MRYLILLLLLSACTPTMNGVTKPAVWHNPMNYLDTFPLGSVTEGELISNLGEPEHYRERNGNTYLTYELSKAAQKQYVYEVSDGVVTDVRYHDNGPYNGTTARERQGG